MPALAEISKSKWKHFSTAASREWHLKIITLLVHMLEKHFSSSSSQLLLDPDPTKRPSARDLCKHAVLREERTGRLAAQLRRELNVEKFRTAMLEK